MYRRIPSRVSSALTMAAALLIASESFGQDASQVSGWTLVWADEFNVDGHPDTEKWDYEVGFLRNNESQYYTRGRTENARVEAGQLVLEARKEKWPNADFGVKQRQWKGKRNQPFAHYTSASLTTAGKASWTYGRVVVRAKLPKGNGVWPAIWMLGNNMSEVGWPRCGELDIMEFVGFQPTTVHANIHCQKYNHVRQTAKGAKIEVSNPSEEFHVYSMDWSKEQIDFFVDGKKYFTYANEGAGSESWPYDQPHYLILNLAIGGTWGAEQGIDDKIFPQQYLIDYVRVYQRSE